MEVMPDNHRMKWTDKENEQLLSEIKNKVSFREIAKNHKRTIGAIKYKIIRNIITDINDTRKYKSNFKYSEPSMKEIMKITNLTKEDIIDLFEKLKFDYKLNEDNDCNNKKNGIDLLTSLNMMCIMANIGFIIYCFRTY